MSPRKRRRSKLDPFIDQLGDTPDLTAHLPGSQAATFRDPPRPS
jgi:hypothetical protein